MFRAVGPHSHGLATALAADFDRPEALERLVSRLAPRGTFASQLDLQRDEVHVLEDGKLCDVASLALVNLPLPEPHAPYAHDVASNDAG